MQPIYGEHKYYLQSYLPKCKNCISHGGAGRGSPGFGKSN